MEAINSKAVGSLIQGIGEDNYLDLPLQIQSYQGSWTKEQRGERDTREERSTDFSLTGLSAITVRRIRYTEHTSQKRLETPSFVLSRFGDFPVCAFEICTGGHDNKIIIVDSVTPNTDIPVKHLHESPVPPIKRDHQPERELVANGATVKGYKNILRLNVATRFKRKEMRKRDPTVRVQMVYYGTRHPSAVEGITNKGFVPGIDGNGVANATDTGYWGRGIYTSPDARRRTLCVLDILVDRSGSSSMSVKFYLRAQPFLVLDVLLDTKVIYKEGYRYLVLRSTTQFYSPGGKTVVSGMRKWLPSILKLLFLSSVLSDDRNGLNGFYSTAGGPTWKNRMGWTDNSDPCSSMPPPFGVECTNGFVSAIRLPNNTLSGNLNADKLVHLLLLDVSSNPISSIQWSPPLPTRHFLNVSNCDKLQPKLLMGLLGGTISDMDISSTSVNVGLLDTLLSPQNLVSLNMSNTRSIALSSFQQIINATPLQTLIASHNRKMFNDLLTPPLDNIQFGVNSLPHRHLLTLDRASLITLDLTDNGLTGCLSNLRIHPFQTLQLGGNLLTLCLPRPIAPLHPDRLDALKFLNVSDNPKLSGSLDLSNAIHLDHLYAAHTGLLSIKFDLCQIELRAASRSVVVTSIGLGVECYRKATGTTFSCHTTNRSIEIDVGLACSNCDMEESTTSTSSSIITSTTSSTTSTSSSTSSSTTSSSTTSSLITSSSTTSTMDTPTSTVDETERCRERYHSIESNSTDGNLGDQIHSVAMMNRHCANLLDSFLWNVTSSKLGGGGHYELTSDRLNISAYKISQRKDVDVECSGKSYGQIPANVIQSIPINSTVLMSVINFDPYTTENNFGHPDIVMMTIFNEAGEEIPVKDTVSSITIGMNANQTDYNECVWWDRSTRGWSAEGCTLIRNGTSLVCSCNHLTSFTLRNNSTMKDSSTTPNNTKWIIIGVVIAIVVIVIVITIAVVCIVLRRKRVMYQSIITDDHPMSLNVQMDSLQMKEKLSDHCVKAIYQLAPVVIMSFRNKRDRDEYAMMMQRIKHVNVVQYLGNHDSFDGKHHIVTNFIEGELLSDWIHHSWEINDAELIVMQLAGVMAHLFDYDLVMDSLSLRKILLQKDFEGNISIKLWDFRCNDPPLLYQAPERVRGEVTEESAVWAFGIVSLQSIQGREYNQGETRDRSLAHSSDRSVNVDPLSRPRFREICKNHTAPVQTVKYNLLEDDEGAYN
ncbi:YadA/hemagluttinin like protein [Planoprotostelium fungivorum]|uniref:YadA/hemagluttinin like protein n=1 Tax=Planoprotostelium fungivorum TaxID=1890364 RepID=A0A2P6N0B4_9EUKA|nr:YadA/hemagluttinin like protein [Planoprotostelium fungivorum]